MRRVRTNPGGTVARGRTPTASHQKPERPVPIFPTQVLTVHPTAVVLGSVGEGTIVGAHAWIGPHVTIGRDCIIGSGARVGQDGFGYERDSEGRWVPKSHEHGVVIDDDVHIGANTCIDRGSWRDTTVGRGSRIDNLVHIAHNVLIGRDAMVIAHAEVSGSVTVGDGAWIGPGACILQRLTVGDRALVGIGSVVIKDVPGDVTVAGNPAKVINAEVGVRDGM